MLNMIDRFGVRAATGRDVLGYGEMTRMRHAEFIVKSYNAREASENWAEFAKQNPAASHALSEAERLANE